MKSRAFLGLAVVTVACVWALDFDLAVLLTRSHDFVPLLEGLTTPDLSAGALARAGRLCLDTLAIALWGTALGAGAGLVFAVLGAATHTRRTPTRARVAANVINLGLDALRAVPDFAWALAILLVLGPGPLTGMLAIAMTVCGVLGRAYGQLLDAVPSSHVRGAERLGASRIPEIVYGRLPTIGPAAWSYTLARLECSVRNASVIGVVGGGGLGAELFEELGYGRMDRVATLLLTSIALTGFADLGSAWLRRRFSNDHGWRDGVGLPSTLVLLAGAAWLLPAVIDVVDHLRRVDLTLASSAATRLASPQITTLFQGDTWVSAIQPVALAWTSTAFAVAVALLLLPWTSSSVRARTHGPARRASPHASVWAFALRAGALVARAVPEVAWLLVLAVALRMGTLAAAIALSIHASGILIRLFTEAVDDDNRDFARSGPPSTGPAWLAYWALPRLRGTLATHVALQGEANLRAAFTLGIVGAGGLGDAFHSAIGYWQLERASALVLAMIALFVTIDRLARRVTTPRNR